MDVIVKELPAFNRDVTIRVAAGRVKELMEQELGRLASTVQLPGFRPGKIPKQVLESRFRDRIASKIVEQLVHETYHKALKEKDLIPLDHQPKLEIGKLVRGEDFVYTAQIQVYPKVEPKKYTGLTLTQRKASITEADIDNVVQHFRKDHAHFEVVTDRNAALGDQVLLDYAGRLDGELFPGGQADGHLLELGTGRFIPGFETQLVGSHAGEERQIQVTFPENYHATHLAGKEVSFDCKIHEIRSRVLPPEDDNLASLSGTKEGGLAQMRRDIQKRLEISAKKASREQVKGAIFNQLLAANSMEVPGVLLKKESLAMAALAKQEYKKQGLDPEKIGLSDEQLASRFVNEAKNRVILGILLGTIAEKENITVDDAALDDRLNEMDTIYGQEQADAMKQWLRSSEERMDDFRISVREDMVTRWIRTNSTVTEQSCTLEELMGKLDPATG